jgi:hypothetical protein
MRLKVSESFEEYCLWKKVCAEIVYPSQIWSVGYVKIVKT